MAQGNPELLKALYKIDPSQPYGTKLFDALALLTVSVAIESVCLRYVGSQTLLSHFFRRCLHFLGSLMGYYTARKVEVYLTQRSENDTAYPGEWHCPGSFLRPGEEISHVFDRLSKREFKAHVSPIQFVANVNLPTEARGHVLSVVYLCTLKGEGLRGRWFPVDQLPEKTVECHRCRIIPAAVGAFVAENTKICV